jgi:hypothetical protein
MPFDAEDRPPSTRASRRPAHAIFGYPVGARGTTALATWGSLASGPIAAAADDRIREIAIVQTGLPARHSARWYRPSAGEQQQLSERCR